MKKLLAAAMAVLTAAVMAGCGSTADEQLIEDISEDTSITSEAEAPEIEETSKAAETSETEAEETASETESETTAETTVPETEHITEADTTSEEIVSETEADNEPRLTQQEDVEGIWRSDNGTILIFQDDKYTELSGNHIYFSTVNVNDGKLEFADDDFSRDVGVMTVYNGKISCDYGFAVVTFEHYTQPTLSLDDFDGKWYLADFDSLGRWGSGKFTLENGKGTFDPEGKDNLPIDAEVSINGDKVTFTVGKDKSKYTYYVIYDSFTYLYLLNDENAVCLVNYGT